MEEIVFVDDEEPFHITEKEFLDRLRAAYDRGYTEGHSVGWSKAIDAMEDGEI